MSELNDPELQSNVRSIGALVADKAMHGQLKYKRQEHDLYETPVWCTEALLPYLNHDFNIWEPACGRGAIVKCLRSRGFDVLATDKMAHLGTGEFTPDALWDFIKDSPVTAAQSFLAKTPRSIVTNPPYKNSKEFVSTACSYARYMKTEVAMLLRLEWQSAKKHAQLMDEVDTVVVLRKRPRWIVDSTGSPRHNYAWYIWDYSQPPTPAALKFAA